MSSGSVSASGSDEILGYLYSNGPDCDKGPNCCCGKCNFYNDAEGCNPDRCCKCIPKTLCAVHYPYTDSDSTSASSSVSASISSSLSASSDYQAECEARSVEMNYTVNWSGSLPGIDPANVNNTIEVNIVKIGEDCFFQVYIPARSIDERYAIEGGKAQCTDSPEPRVKCRDPRFTIADFELNGCYGDLVIQRKELKTLKFRTPIELETVVAGGTNPCGECSEWCGTICMEWSIPGGQVTKTEFAIVYGNASTSWEAAFPDQSGATILAVQGEDGRCRLEITHPGLGDFEPVLIPTGMCNIGMVIEATGTGAVVADSGKTVSISCNKCSCWDYVCESCRCVCPTLCVVSVNGTQQTDIHRYELDWDPDEQRWGDETKWVKVQPNLETGACEFLISDWNAADSTSGSDNPLIDYEASTLTIEECGKDMWYSVIATEEDAFSGNVFHYEYGACKTCDPECFKSFCDDCCSECDFPLLPETLYFDIIGSPIAGDPEGNPRCLAVYDIPLVHTRPLFGASHRWEGHAIVDCTQTIIPPYGPNKTRIDILIDCTGTLWTITVRMKGETANFTSQDVVNSNDPIKTSSFSCSPVQWTGAFNTDLITAGCCAGVFEFQFVVSE